MEKERRYRSTFFKPQIVKQAIYHLKDRGYSASRRFTAVACSSVAGCATVEGHGFKPCR